MYNLSNIKFKEDRKVYGYTRLCNVNGEVIKNISKQCHDKELYLLLFSV